MAAPTRAFSSAIPFATKAGTTATFGLLTADVGDVITVRGGTEDQPYTLGVSDNTGGGLTWTLQQSDVTVGRGNIYVWSAVVNSLVVNGTVTMTCSTTGHCWGGRLSQWTGSAGIGTSGKTAAGGAAPTIALAGVLDNSALEGALTDWSAAAATGTWGGSATATSETATQVGGLATYYEAYYADAGAAGTKNVSMTLPAGAVPNMVAIEIKGLASGGVNYKLANVRSPRMRARR